MSTQSIPTKTSYTAFANHTDLIQSSSNLKELVAAVLKKSCEVTIFDDFTGRRTELEPDADPEQVLQRLTGSRPSSPTKRSGPGRPKLGVRSKEISLLPRHWEWLSRQSGGASATLRRLVEQARKQFPARDAARQATEATGSIMTVLAGDEAGYEEASRTLYAGHFSETLKIVEGWHLQAYFERLIQRAQDLHRLAETEAAQNPLP